MQVVLTAIPKWDTSSLTFQGMPWRSAIRMPPLLVTDNVTRAEIGVKVRHGEQMLTTRARALPPRWMERGVESAPAIGILLASLERRTAEHGRG